MRRTSLADIARDACARCAVREPTPVCGEADPDAFVQADPERLVTMVEHLLRNAQDATPASGTVRVDVSVLRDVELDATEVAILLTGIDLASVKRRRRYALPPASEISEPSSLETRV